MAQIRMCSSIRLSFDGVSSLGLFSRSGRRSAIRTSDALPMPHTQIAARLHRKELHKSKYCESVKCLGTTKCLGRPFSLDGCSIERMRQAPV